VYYAANAFPAGYRGGMVLGDVVNNRINYFRVERKGASYTALQQPDLLISDDPWFRPCDIKLGPDGALYVADFYNRIIGHYEVPLDHPGRDRTSGRIWRIVYRGERPNAPRPDRTDWTKASVEELVRALNHPNLVVRLTATHQLVERGRPAAGAIVGAKGLTPRQIAYAFWVLERLGLQDDNLFYGVGPDPLIDAQRMRTLAERTPWTDADRGLAQRCLYHSDRLVVRLAVQALYRDPSPKWRHEILELLRGSAPDPFLHHALRLALREQYRGQDNWDVPQDELTKVADIALGLPEPAAATFLRVNLAALDTTTHDGTEFFVRHIARYGRPDDLAGLAEVLRALPLHFPHSKERTLAYQILAAHEGAQEAGRELPADLIALGTELAGKLIGSNDYAAPAGVKLAAVLRRPELTGGLTRLAGDRKRPEALRAAAYAALLGCDAVAIPTVAAPLTDSTEPAAVREGAAKALAEQNTAAARDALAKALGAVPARLASAIATGLAATEPGAEQLCDAVAAGKASPRLLTEKPVQLKLAAIKKPAVRKRVAALTEGLPPADALTAKLLRDRLAAYAQSPRDPAAGAKVYAKHCANCHQVGGQGSKIGPQLDGIGIRGLERLLEDVLDPSRNVDQSFRTTTVALKSGRTTSGLLLREEGRTLVLADHEGKEQRFAVDDIDTREVSPASPMPPNWGQVIPEGEFHDLMAYLLSLKVK
jgi:putative heme-binding domain-containing protein